MDEDVELDTKYKQYAVQVEKVLKQFESPREWADLCSYLTKLKRILQNNAKYNLIPKKLLVAKRLSQCLHHALPSGVHLKTLEVYVIIFKRIGMERLSRDLSIYSMGLFPLLGHSAMSVRPKLFDIFDTFYIPLGTNLEPCLHGFILSLLSGLEEGSEHFEAVTALLGKVKQVTDRTLFYGCLWRALISDPTVRYQGSFYVLSQITKRKRVGQAILGDNRETLIKALCLGLQDSNTLTQRNFLDFALFACPLNTREFSRSDILKLLQAGLCVLLRRDMSLNRRVYSWLEGHGAEEANETKRISMTSMELHNIMEEGSKVQTDGPDSKTEERFETPSDLTPRLVRKAGGDEEGLSNGYSTEPRAREESDLESAPSAPPPESSDREEGSTEEERGMYENIYDLDTEETVTPVSTDPSVTSPGVVTSPEDETDTDGARPGLSRQDSTLSPDEIAEIRTKFYNQYGRPYMMTCLRDMLYVGSEDKNVVMQPYRIINSLMDRQDFGSAIVEDLLVDINRALYNKCVAQGVSVTPSNVNQLKLLTTTTSKELIKAANHLLGTFEPGLLWDWLSDQLKNRPPTDKDGNNKLFVPSSPPEFEEILSLTDFLLEIVSFEYSASVQSTFLPQVLQSICKYLRAHVADLPGATLAHAIETSSNLLSRAQPTTVNTDNLYSNTDYKKDGEEVEVAEKKSDEGDERKKKNKSVSESTKELQMDEMSVMLEVESEDDTTLAKPAVVETLPSQDYVSEAISIYQEFLHNLIKTRVLTAYTKTSRDETDLEEIVTMFLPACALLLDFACFPIFCNMDNESLRQPLLLTDSTINGKIDEKIALPGWLLSLLECCKITKWEEIVLSSIKTLTVLIGLTLSIAEEQGAGRKALEGSVAVVLMPMLSETQLRYIQSKTTYFADIVQSLWGYLAANYANLHHRVVKLLWKLHHLAPSPDITEDVIGAMLSSNLVSNRLEALRRFTVFWHISASLADNCKEWSKLQVSGKDLSRTTLVLLECLGGSDYQSRLLAKAWISQCFHYGDLNRILDPLLIQLLHPSSARKLALPEAYSPPEPEDTLSVHSREAEDAHSLNTRTKLSVFSEDSEAEYSTAESDMTAEHEMVRQKSDEKKRTDCQNELFYSQEYDTNRSKYLWQIILSMMQADPTPFIRSCNFAKFNATSKYLSQEVYELFHKHRMSIRDELYADPFFMTTLSEKDPKLDSRLSVAERLRKISKSYLELLVTVCLWYCRARYDHKRANVTVCESNREVRLVAVEFLSTLVQKCVSLPHDLKKIACETIFDRCHLQESVLYVLQRSIVAHTEAAYIVQEDLEILEWTKVFQSELLVLVQNILKLEKDVGWGDSSKLSVPLSKYEFDYKYVNYYMNCQDTHIAKVNLVDTEVETSNNPKYIQNLPLVGQPLFVHCVLVALTTRRVTFIHKKWLDTIFSCFDYKSPLIKKLSEVTVQQILHNTRQLSKEYHNIKTPNPVVGCVPVNQAVLLLESLTSVVHFILVHAPVVQSSNSSDSRSGFLMLFSMSNETANTASDTEYEFVNEAKHHMLQFIPKCFDTLLDVWMNWKMVDSEKVENLFPWGKPLDVRNLVLNFVSPLFKKYPASMLSSLCEVWHLNRRNLIFGRPGHLVSAPSKKQLALIDLIMDITVCTYDVVLKNAQKLLNTAASHPRDSREQFGFSFETELVHLAYEYFRHLKKHTMQKAWPHLLNLLREACTITNQPPVTLLAVGFLQLYLTNCPQVDDTKSRRELQEVTVKLIELTTEIASKSLSLNSWFGRKAEVLPEYNEIVSVKKEDSEDSSSDEENYEGNNVYTLQAIYVLNECLAQIIDLVYGSEEKDKAIAILSPLISKISVYIRNHAHHNMPNSKASAALLSSITDYQYCRKAWSKELFEALMDPEFFIMDPTALPQWKIITEHLIAHDNLLFQDLLVRVTTATGGLFSSNEVFYTQKARLLRRLSFTIFCCEYNQFAKYISKIQECFVEALKLGQAYQVIREVFLGFRVVILRMSPGTYTPLWPIMLNELYGNLVEFRDTLKKKKSQDGPGFSSKMLAMYLSISKLLDQALILPSHMIPDFQVHHWSFVCDRPLDEQPDLVDQTFASLSREICEAYEVVEMEDEKLLRTRNAPYLSQANIHTFWDLQPFYTGLAKFGLFKTLDKDLTEENTLKLLEESLDLEFLDLN
ncbi:hypothetical protein ACHWQZ_G006460 [Mnemiopsis leidyi]